MMRFRAGVLPFADDNRGLSVLDAAYGLCSGGSRQSVAYKDDLNDERSHGGPEPLETTRATFRRWLTRLLGPRCHKRFGLTKLPEASSNRSPPLQTDQADAASALTGTNSLRSKHDILTTPFRGSVRDARAGTLVPVYSPRNGCGLPAD